MSGRREYGGERAEAGTGMNRNKPELNRTSTTLLTTTLPRPPTFRPSDVFPATGADAGNVTLEDARAVLIAALGRMKHIGYGWEEKHLLELYEGKELKRG
jgi:hypothetical protein